MKQIADASEIVVPSTKVATVALHSNQTSTRVDAPRMNRQSQFVQNKYNPVPFIRSSRPMNLGNMLSERFPGNEQPDPQTADDDAEVIIEPTGRIRKPFVGLLSYDIPAVRPQRRMFSSRHAGFLEPFNLPEIPESSEAFKKVTDEETDSIDRDLELLRDRLLLNKLRGDYQKNNRGAQENESANFRQVLEKEIHALLKGDTDAAAARPLGNIPSRIFSGLQVGSSASTESNNKEMHNGSTILTSPLGCFVAFIIGFGGIMLIAMLCCVIRAAYVKRQKARLKAILAEKLGHPLDGTETGKQVSSSERAFSTVGKIEAGVSADPEWVDVRVEEKNPPEEEQMINVARHDTLIKCGFPADTTSDEETAEAFFLRKDTTEDQREVPTHKSARHEKDVQHEGRTRKRHDRKGKDKLAEKPSRIASGDKISSEKRKKAERKEKQLRKVLSSRRTVRLAG